MKISDFKIRKHDKYFYRGEWSEEIFKKSIAIVGSRRVTRYGKEVTDKFVASFVANRVTTISGFMYGVDTEVHQKTVDYGGKTVAVFGCGLDVIYPPENEKLYQQILETGGLTISEYEASAKPHLWKFPQRNKIVASLSSLGVLVVEAGEASGSLITARLAKKMGKKVYAVPGPITSSTSEGTNALIKKGEATMVTCVSDILKIRNQKVKIQIKNQNFSNPIEAKIFEQLSLEPMDIDEIVRKTGKDVMEIGSTLSIMGIKGLVTESGGKYYISK